MLYTKKYILDFFWLTFDSNIYYAKKILTCGVLWSLEILLKLITSHWYTKNSSL